MNVANLQIEGLIMALASVNQALVRKGILTVDELDNALRSADAAGSAEDRSEEMSPANRDAVAFPIRLLLLANRNQDGTNILSFSELTRLVGQTKEPYNDQM